jgi:hypothetical protein
VSLSYNKCHIFTSNVTVRQQASLVDKHNLWYNKSIGKWQNVKQYFQCLDFILYRAFFFHQWLWDSISLLQFFCVNVFVVCACVCVCLFVCVWVCECVCAWVCGCVCVGGYISLCDSSPLLMPTWGCLCLVLMHTWTCEI